MPIFSCQISKRLFLILVFSEVWKDWHLFTINKSTNKSNLYIFHFLKLSFCYFKEECLVVFSYIPLYFVVFGPSSFLSLFVRVLSLTLSLSPLFSQAALPLAFLSYMLHSHLLSSFLPLDLLLFAHALPSLLL